MAMNISSNYGEHYANTFSAQNKENTRPSEVRSNALENSKDSVDEYYEKLCKKFPKINIYITNISKVTGMGDFKMGDENTPVLSISRECLKKMAADPAFAKKIEDDILGIPEGKAWLYAKAKSDGKKVLEDGIIINADGGMQAAAKMVRVNDSNKSTSILNIKNLTKDKLEKMRKENLERRKEEAERIEEAREEKREKEAYMDRLLDKYSEAVNTYDATGYEIENVTSAINRQV